MDAEQRFEQIVARFLPDPAVTEGTGFGSSPGLRVNGKIFAMLLRGELIVKLPRERVEELVAARTGTPFDPGHGRVMKEWATVPARHSDAWDQLANESFEFVGSAAAKTRRR